MLAAGRHLAQGLEQRERPADVSRELIGGFEVPVGVVSGEPRLALLLGKGPQAEDVHGELLEEVRDDHAHHGGAVGHPHGEGAVDHLHLGRDLLRVVKAEGFDRVVHVERALASVDRFLLQRLALLAAGRGGQKAAGAGGLRPAAGVDARVTAIALAAGPALGLGLGLIRGGLNCLGGNLGNLRLGNLRDHGGLGLRGGRRRRGLVRDGLGRCRGLGLGRDLRGGRGLRLVRGFGSRRRIGGWNFRSGLGSGWLGGGRGRFGGGRRGRSGLGGGRRGNFRGRRHRLGHRLLERLLIHGVITQH